ncbi:MAG: asparagine--tRNA ligase [Oscillospiraceae bacterium]
MKHTAITELYTSIPKDGAELTVCGWVRTVRDSKNIGFIELNDGSCFKNLQIVFEAAKLNNYAQIAKAGVGTSMQICGICVSTPNSKQAFELNANSITIIGEAGSDYPLQKKRHSVEFLRTMPHLRARTNTFAAAFRVRSVVSFAIHKFFQERGFVYVHTPLITGSDCEGAGEMFHVTTLDAKNPPLLENGKVDYSKDFFARPTNLTVSGQLEGEAMSAALGNIYTFGPTFRAEDSNTPRHAAEFWMIEPEMSFADLSDYMDNAEEMTKYIIETVLEKCPDELAFFNQFYDKELLERLGSLVNSSFERLSYTDAVKLLEPHNAEFQYPVSWGIDLQTEHERYLTEKIFKKPVFVTDYPKDIKSFYMRLNDDGKTVAAADMLVPGVGELIGGSQREERLDMLEARMKEMNLNCDDYEWYLDLRRYGSVKHAGYGLGFDRIIMYLTGIPNIRDVIPFPRTAGGF